MKEFFKFTFASMLGFFLINLILFFLFIGMVASIVSFADKEVVKVEENSLLSMKLNTPILERTPVNPFENFDFQSMKTNESIGLNDLINNIDKAAGDDRIKGIYLDLSAIPASMASIEAVRDKLIEFKQSGKFILAYSEYYSQGAYYLATVADEIYLNPEGSIIFKGIAADVMFMKGTMDKLDVDVQVVRHGKFKAAVEPFVNEKMSDENRKQMETLIGSLWEEVIGSISESRGISEAELNRIADNLDVKNAKAALDLGFVDKLYYKDEVLDALKEKLGLEEDDKISSLSIAKYTNAEEQEEKEFSKNKIAVVYAVGEIVGGEGSDQVIGSERISKAIRKARKDDKVKAIVLRVNSPGGSALASEVIYREIMLAKEVKPVIASYGDLAASGGYWISCGANKIVSEATTITGSIGVFGLIPNFEDFFKNKLGITFDLAATNDNADFITTNRAMTDYQEAILQEEIDRIYETFLDHVSQSRPLTREQVDEVGQGRVWAGTDALRIGLVDELGGMKRAIEIAAAEAELGEDYRVVEYPTQKDPFEELINELTGSASASIIQKELGSNYKYFEYLKSVENMQGMQARLPYYIDIR